MNRATITEPVTITGYDLWGFRKTSAVLQPAAWGAGITFKVRDHVIPYDIRHMYGVRGIAGARYVVASEYPDTNLTGEIGEGYQVRVVEHLAAALHFAGVTDVTVVLEGGKDHASVPQDGPGIRPQYECIVARREDTGVRACDIRANGVGNYSFYNERVKRDTTIKVEPCERLEVKVLAARQPDLVDLREQPLHVTDVYAQRDGIIDARPLARIAKWPVFAVWAAARCVGYHGITEQNYVLCKPWDSRDDIINKMLPHYRAGANEFLGHAVIDFVGELAALGGPVRACFTLENSNHITRVRALKKFVKEGVLRAVDG
ncbi:MAG: UDP-3-O-acyl-N-acetylglucosamine deacetylase [Nanoarchaeota archaeon]